MTSGRKHSLLKYQTITITAAIFCTGYVASLFLTYSFVVMPGLAGLDDRAFVAAFQGLETRFQNTANMPGYESFGYSNIPTSIGFFGALVFSIIAAILNWKTKCFKWIFIAFLLFIAGMASTLIYNLPSNIDIFAAGNPEEIDVKQIREKFNEEKWLYSNHFRAATTTLATFCFYWSFYIKLQCKSY